METLLQDLRYGLRTLLKSPTFTAVAAASLALGIGANTLIFSMVNAVLLRPLPVKEPARLAWLFTSDNKSGASYGASSYPDFVDHSNSLRDSFEMSAFAAIPLGLSDDGQTELLAGEIVTGNYFEVLGIKAVRGRTFLPEEDQRPGANPVAVVSEGLWQRRFGSDPSLVGKTVRLNGVNFTVVGIAPESFTGTIPGSSPDAWVPMMMQAQMRPPSSKEARASNAGDDLLGRREMRWLNVIARLKPGFSFEQAQAAMSTSARQLEQAHQTTNEGRGASVYPVSKGRPELRDSLLSFTALLMAVVALVLLIACANVANLLLARATNRQKEIAIRIALGAARARLVRQLLTESVLLSLLGGAVGLGLAYLAHSLLAAYKLGGLVPFSVAVSLDLRVLGFALLVSLVTGLVFGIAPALQATKPDLVPSLKDEVVVLARGYRRFGLRNLLIVAQVTLSLVLLVNAGLFIRSLQKAQTADPGFETEKVLLMSLNLELLKYQEARGRDFYQRVVERVKSLPEVQSVSFVRNVPLGPASSESEIIIEGREASGDGRKISVGTNVVGTRFFETMDITLVRGRDFNDQDREGAPRGAIINETMARRFWPGEDPLGKRLRLANREDQPVEIVGVAKDSKYLSLGESARSQLYLPLAQNYSPRVTLLVRTVGQPTGPLAAVRRELQALDKDLPVFDAKPMADHISRSLAPLRAGAALLGVFGLLALALASVGLYGTMSYAVSRRTREIGIRMALGARAGNVLGLVLGEGMKLVASGVVLGLLLSFAVTRLLSSFLYGISPSDPVTFAGVGLLLCLVALAASYIPSRRATKIDPMVALRSQ